MRRSLRYLRRQWKRIVVILVILFVVANGLAVRHAEWFLVYSESGGELPRPEGLTRWQKAGTLVRGVRVPRPENVRTPETIGRAYSTHRTEIGAEWLELWELERENARGIVLMLPGYASAKSSLLPEAKFFHDEGFAVALLDFRGAGGSSGHDNTLGIREANDVARAAAFLRDRHSNLKQIAFGRSMGSVATLRAAGTIDVRFDAMILESPFDRMSNAVRNRFRTMGVPSWPGAELLVFWGGRRIGIDGFTHNPVEYAERIDTPTLLIVGETDANATQDQVRAVYDRLRGAKSFHIVPKAGHEPLLARDPSIWKFATREFLGRHFAP